MEIYTITYASLCGGQLYTETKVFKDKEKLKQAYADYIRDIANNIIDPDECEHFCKEHETFDLVHSDAHWEAWGGDEMYIVASEAHTID